MADIKWTKVKNAGSNMVTWRLDINGQKIGAVYTFVAKNEIHPWHVTSIDGGHLGWFYKDAALTIPGDERYHVGTLKEAKAYLEKNG